MELDADTLTVLRPAVEAARVVLRRLDDEEVPAALRRVRASSARALPPPLAQTLAEALDEDADLRAATAEELGTGPDVTAARAFLTRVQGWEELVGDAVDAAASQGKDREVRRLEAEVARLARRRAADEEKVAELRNREEEVRRELAEESARRRRAVADAVAEARDEAAGLRERLATAEAALAVATAERDRLAERLDRARADLLQLRRRPDEATEPGPTWGWAGDALGLAKHADEVFSASKARIAVGPGTPVDAAVADAGPMRLPPGISPDTAEAVEAVLDWSAVVYVDGYNLAGALGADIAEPAEARRVARAGVDRLRARAAGRVVAVFDSAEGPDERPGEVYAIDADEELRRRAAVDPGRTVVVSDDREVIDGVSAAGAVALWSRAVARWLGV